MFKFKPDQTKSKKPTEIIKNRRKSIKLVLFGFLCNNRSVWFGFRLKKLKLNQTKPNCSNTKKKNLLYPYILLYRQKCPHIPILTLTCTLTLLTSHTILSCAPSTTTSLSSHTSSIASLLRLTFAQWYTQFSLSHPQVRPSPYSLLTVTMVPPFSAAMRWHPLSSLVTIAMLSTVHPSPLHLQRQSCCLLILAQLLIKWALSLSMSTISLCKQIECNFFFELRVFYFTKKKKFGIFFLCGKKVGHVLLVCLGLWLVVCFSFF